MGILARFTTYIKSLINAWLNRAEDPSVTLDYAYEQQLEQLQNLRRGIADVVTNEKRLELQEAQLHQQMDKLDSQAREAVGLQRDDLARVALERKQGLGQYLTSYDQQIQQLKAQQQQFTDLEARMSARVESFRAQKELTKAQYGAAHAQVQIQEAATGISEEMTDVNLAVQRAQDKVQQMQARGAALDALIASGTLTEIGPAGRDEIDRQLGAITDKAEVEQQLAALKAATPLPAGTQPDMLPPAHEPASEQAQNA